MEPAGRNGWQPVANRATTKSAEPSHIRCRGLRPVAPKRRGKERGKPERRHQLAAGELGQHPRVDPIHLAGQRRQPLHVLRVRDAPTSTVERELRRLGADHRYVPLLLTVPGISWVLAYSIAAELGDITRFPTPRKLAGYSGLCPRVFQSSERDPRGPLAKQGPRYLRWALVGAAMHACTHPAYRDRY
jgi:transposase